MKQPYRLFVILAVLVMPFIAFAQDRNNDDEVIKLDPRTSRFDAVEGEVLVKFRDNAAVRMTTTRSGEYQTCGIRAVDDVLSSFGMEKVEQLCPANPTRSLRRSPSYGGGEVVEHDMTKLYRIRLNADDRQRSYELIEQLKQCGDIEYAEPNYIVSTSSRTVGSRHFEQYCTQSNRHNRYRCRYRPSRPCRQHLDQSQREPDRQWLRQRQQRLRRRPPRLGLCEPDRHHARLQQSRNALCWYCSRSRYQRHRYDRSQSAGTHYAALRIAEQWNR